MKKVFVLFEKHDCEDYVDGVYEEKDDADSDMEGLNKTNTCENISYSVEGFYLIPAGGIRESIS